jgi:hypothetical protein
MQYCVATDSTFGNMAGSAGWGTYWTGDSSWSGSVKYLKGGAFNAHYGSISYRMGYSGGNIPNRYYVLDYNMYGAWRSTSIIKRSANSFVQDASDNTYIHCLNYHG